MKPIQKLADITVILIDESDIPVCFKQRLDIEAWSPELLQIDLHNRNLMQHEWRANKDDIVRLGRYGVNLNRLVDFKVHKL